MHQIFQINRKLGHLYGPNSLLLGWRRELMPLDIFVLFQLLVYETLVERKEDTDHELVDV
jgi:hypothetical protein